MVSQETQKKSWAITLKASLITFPVMNFFILIFKTYYLLYIFLTSIIILITILLA